MSVGMTGDNYTSDRFRTLQSAVKAAGAVVVRGAISRQCDAMFFPAILLCLEPSAPLHIHIFSYCDAAVAAVASGCSMI